MPKEKAPQREQDKDNFTYRIPKKDNEVLKELANELGISQNSLIQLFVNLGIKSYYDIILHHQEEFRRFVSQNLK